MHLPPQVERTRRGAKRMVAAAKSWSWGDVPRWWPVIGAVAALIFAAAQVNARVSNFEHLNEAQDARLATLEKTATDAAVTSARVDERTAAMQAQLSRMEAKLN